MTSNIRLGQGRKVHLIGIAGAGMSGVAVLLKQAGWRVSGSDQDFYPPVSDYLKTEKIPVRTPYSKANIPADTKLVVVGKHSRLTADQVEVKEAILRDLPIVSFPDVLSELTERTNNLVVVGSFGKSTVSSLISWILIAAKKRPSYFIGAVPIGFRQSASLSSGKDFILEGDEYPSSNFDPRSKFLHYNARSLVLTGAVHDHFNVFKTLQDYLSPFKDLARSLPEDGFLVSADRGENNRTIEKKTRARLVHYGLKSGDYQGKNISYRQETVFDLYHHGQKIVTLSTKLFGNHNIENIVAASALLLETRSVSSDELRAGVKSYLGLRRRLELKTRPETEVLAYEDLSSSYEKASTTLEALSQRYPKRAIVAVFQPNTIGFRRKESLAEYPKLFRQTKMVILVPTPGELPVEELSPSEILEAIRIGQPKSRLVKNRDEGLKAIEETVSRGDIVLFMTSGALLGLIEPATSMLDKKFG